jgi:Sec-independent protein translocase protein TatA
MSKEMVKISFNDWQTIGSELYKNNPEEFMKQAEEYGLDKEAEPITLMTLGLISGGLLGWEALKGIGSWLNREFKGSARPEFASNYAAQDQAFEVMKLLEQSPDLRKTVVGAEKLHNRLQELSGTIMGLRNYMSKVYDRKKAEDKKTEKAEATKSESAELAAAMKDLTGGGAEATPAATPAPATPAPATPAKA